MTCKDHICLNCAKLAIQKKLSARLDSICCPMCKVQPVPGIVMFEDVAKAGYKLKPHYWEKMAACTITFDDDTRI
jgi:hypothetical protein